MLKQYHDRNEKTAKTETVPVCSVHAKIVNHSENEDESVSDTCFSNTGFRLKNSQILSDLSETLDHLTLPHQSEMSNLLQEYSHLFHDVPGKTDAVFHDIDVGDAVPIKQNPYRVGPHKQICMNEEVQYMLDNDIIEESDSNWSSPCILVPKPDSSKGKIGIEV